MLATGSLRAKCNSRLNPACYLLPANRIDYCLPPLKVVLFPESQTFDYISVTFNIIIFNVVEQSSSLTYQLQKAAAGMMILFVRFKMLGQIFDPCTEQGNLNFGRTRILFMQSIFSNYCFPFLRS